jgi:hypothetical protein
MFLVDDRSHTALSHKRNQYRIFQCTWVNHCNVTTPAALWTMQPRHCSTPIKWRASTATAPSVHRVHTLTASHTECKEYRRPRGKWCYTLLLSDQLLPTGGLLPVVCSQCIRTASQAQVAFQQLFTSQSYRYRYSRYISHTHTGFGPCG